MNKQKAFLTLLLSLGLIFGTAQASNAKIESTESTNEFSRLEQPLPLKLLVTLGGLGLIGAEVWWFLFSKTKSQQATSHQGIQELEITVDGGYNPDRIVVQAGQPVRLNFFRKDPNSCLEKVLLPDFHKALDLQLNQTTSVEFTPTEAGEYTFHCGMNMFRGVVKVQGSNQQERSATKDHHHIHQPPEKAHEMSLNAILHQGVQEMDIEVKKGYEPSRIIVKAGLPVKLNFFRQDANKCLEKVFFPDFNIALDVPLNQMVSAQFTPTQPGKYTFTCGMEMFHGIVEVKA